MVVRLRSLFGATPLKHADALPPGRVRLVEKRLAGLDRVRRGFAARAVRYVVDGEEGEILLELAAKKGGGAALELVCVPPTTLALMGRALLHAVRRTTMSEPEGDLYGGLTAAHGDFLLRLARIYEAASRRDNRHLSGDWLGAPEWLEIVLLEAQKHTFPLGPDRPPFPLDAEVIEAALVADDRSPGLLIEGALGGDVHDWTQQALRSLFADIEGLAQSVARHPEALAAVLSQPAATKVAALRFLHAHGVDPRPLLERLVELAVGKAKTVREAAEAVLRPVKAEVRPLLAERAASGNGGERDRAVRLLWRFYGDEVRSLLEERAEADSSKRVKQTIRELLALPLASEAQGDSGAELELPALAPIELDAPLSEETRGIVRGVVEKLDRDLRAAHQRLAERGDAGWRPNTVLPRGAAERLVRDLESLVCKGKPPDPYLVRGWHLGGSPDRLLSPVFECPDLEPVHFVRLMLLMGELREVEGFSHVGFELDLFARQYRRHHPFDLRTLGATLAALGFDDRSVGRQRLGHNYSRAFLWEDEAVWPYFAERLEMLEEALDLRSPAADGKGERSRRRRASVGLDWERPARRRAALEVLATFPQLPPVFVPGMWEVALGTSKTERRLAQAALSGAPGKEEKLRAALRSGRQHVRAAAALWLADLGCSDAIPDLRRALAKEKVEAVQGALLSTLERLGVGIDELLDRDRLLEEAQSGLERGVPEVLGFLHPELIPTVRWADSGEPIDRRVLEWLLVRCYRLKSPEPGPMLRRYVADFVADDREAFGQFVLTSWIAADTQVPSVDEVADEVRQSAKQAAPYMNMSVEQAYRRLLADRLNQCEGSAIKEKGVLAVAGACCGVEGVAACEAYLKRWYGMRAAQCKALLQMLSWIEHPGAIQLLLSVATRFRTKGIQKEAERLVAELAERRQWTIDELGDRTIPIAGFEPRNGDTPSLLLDYGERRLHARLTDELQVSLADESGKLYKSLPAARGDDPDRVKACRRQLSKAKKELKGIVKQQQQRLYEAMCTQRDWQPADWRTYLAGHPIAGRLCQRLIWMLVEGDRLVGTFRPLADGSLSAVDDEELSLPLDEAHRIALAHDRTVPAEVAAAWLEHLADYETEPLFAQFGRGRFELEEGRREETELRDFEGHLLEAFALRSQATKLGYTRGEAQDGGVFHEYRKSFPSLGLEAILEFTGNTLPEENRRVALLGLTIVRALTEQQSPWCAEPRLLLGDVPPVLLAECYADVCAIAAAGSGYDPEWSKKSAW